MLYNIFFSPTGGCKKVANIIAHEINAKCIDIDLLDEIDGKVLNSNDIAIFTLPSYGGRCPATAIERMRRITGNGSRAILVAVYGNRAIEDTLIEMKDVVVGQAFHPIAAIEAIAEHSILHIYGQGRPDADDINELEEFARRIKDIKDLSTVAVPGNFPYKSLPSSGIKPFTTDKCTSCGLCARECPAHAIDATNPALINKEMCISCMHCISICPVKAKKLDEIKVKDIQRKLEPACKDRKENKLYINEYC